MASSAPSPAVLARKERIAAGRRAYLRDRRNGNKDAFDALSWTPAVDPGPQPSQVAAEEKAAAAAAEAARAAADAGIHFRRISRALIEVRMEPADGSRLQLMGLLRIVSLDPVRWRDDPMLRSHLPVGDRSQERSLLHWKSRLVSLSPALRRSAS